MSRSPDLEAADAAHRTSLERLLRLYGDAFTRDEVEAATATRREHDAAYPFDAGTELFHGLGHIIDDLEQREAFAQEFGLSPAEFRERESLLKAAVAALRADPMLRTTANALEDASRMAQSWLAFHSVDVPVAECLESLTEHLRLARELAALA